MSEQVLVRGLPDGTKAGLQARASLNDRSVEAELRRLIIESLENNQPTIVDLLSDDVSADIDFEPARLSLKWRSVEL